MLSYEGLKSFQKECVIDAWFNARVEDLYTLNEIDKKKLETMTKKEGRYQDIENEISRLIKENDRKRILKKIDEYYSKLVNIGDYENEKFYKVGFMDGINLIIESIGKQCF